MKKLYILLILFVFKLTFSDDLIAKYESADINNSCFTTLVDNLNIGNRSEIDILDHANDLLDANIIRANSEVEEIIYEGDLTVTTQAEVDALPQYTKITGKLDVLGGDGNISDLSKFSELKEIGGRLLIQDCPLITDMTGFSSLEIIGSGSSQELAIRRMAGLITLNGLQALTTVSRRIGVWENPVLETLEGLNNLQTIRDNKVSESDGLIRIGTTEESGANPMLVDFCALSGIIEIIGASALDADPLSYINNYTEFNPTFQDISSGTCSATNSIQKLPIENTDVYFYNGLLRFKNTYLDNAELTVFDVAGKIVQRGRANGNEFSINSSISKGIYIIRVVENSRIKIYKKLYIY